MPPEKRRHRGVYEARRSRVGLGGPHIGTRQLSLLVDGPELTIDGQTIRPIDRWTNSWMARQTDGWPDGHMDGQMARWTNVRPSGRP